MLLSVEGLCKSYPKFQLKGVSFQLERGYIMGFIGRNGAGKTTTLKSMLNLVRPDAGRISYFGMDFSRSELACKQRIGAMFGAFSHYPRERLKNIAAVTRRFYDDWDDGVFSSYMDRFELDGGKRVNELSAGMKVKFALALALSHNAELLILDEPTSGLDPVSRDDLVALFQELIEEGGRSILFSPHITSDLEKCADYITYIKDGEIIASTDKEGFTGAYRLVRGREGQLTEALSQRLLGLRKNAFGFEAMARAEDLPYCAGLEAAPANLESVMIHLERE